MQQKIRSPESFLERTDRLAALNSISLRELAPILGISQASLFGYRSGKIPISAKAWSKLEAIEANLEEPKDSSRSGLAFEGSDAVEPRVNSGLAARYGLTNHQLVDLIEMLLKRVLDGELPVSHLHTAERLLKMIRENENASIPR